MAAPRKMIGLGCTLGMAATSTTPASYDTLAGLISFSGPAATADDVDTSTLDNSTSITSGAWKTFQRGQVDPGEVSATLSYSSTESVNKKLGTAFKAGTVRKWKVAFPTTSVSAETFNGYIKSMGREIGGAGSMIQRSITIKVTDNPGFPST
jgi:predicted secreted protein